MDQMVAGGPTATMSAAAGGVVLRGAREGEGGGVPEDGVLTAGRSEEAGDGRRPAEEARPAEVAGGAEVACGGSGGRRGEGEGGLGSGGLGRHVEGGAWRPAASSEDAGKSGSLPAWGRGPCARP